MENGGSIHDLVPQLANCHDYWLGWGKTSDTADGDLSLYRSDVAHPLLNGVLRLRNAGLEGAIAEARERLDGVPWLWWVGPDSDPGVADGLLAAGAMQVEAMPVMAARTNRVDGFAGPPGLSVEEVTGLDALGDYVAAYAPPLDVPLDQVDAVVDREANRTDRPGELVRFSGRVGGEVVGTSALLERDGVAGVYVVSTAESHRRRGIGAALTEAAVRAGRERGLRVATLQATSAGEPLYARMGFETVAEYRLFAL